MSIIQILCTHRNEQKNHWNRIECDEEHHQPNRTPAQLTRMRRTRNATAAAAAHLTVLLHEFDSILIHLHRSAALTAHSSRDDGNEIRFRFFPAFTFDLIKFYEWIKWKWVSVRHSALDAMETNAQNRNKKQKLRIRTIHSCWCCVDVGWQRPM